MSFDFLKLEEKHKEVRKAVDDDEPGHAQSEVGDVLVSYIRHAFPGGFFHAPMHPQKSANEIIDEMMVDVARGDGIASKATFDLSQVKWAIADRRKYPEHWVKKHKEANLLEQLVGERPELFV